MQIGEFKTKLKPVTDFINGRALSAELAEQLNLRFPAHGETFADIENACHQAIADGWMCANGGAGRRFGRVIEPSEDTGGLSVDVVDLIDIAGPHHRHPKGEICMVMPVTEGAAFDGCPGGWCVYEPDSAHHPTVSNGRALVLYFLPDGEIEFTRQ